MLDKSEITTSLSSKDEDTIFIEPLLEESQVGSVSVDLRLGYDFLVSHQTRSPYIGIDSSETRFRGIDLYFKPTRRELGDYFILHPGQIVLASTLEYICVPSTISADVISRSSYNRLGITFNTMVQPGYRGCIALELINSGNNIVETIVGSRIAQIRFHSIVNGQEYIRGRERKYFGNIRPTVSKISKDNEIRILRSSKEHQQTAL